MASVLEWHLQFAQKGKNTAAGAGKCWASSVICLRHSAADILTFVKCLRLHFWWMCRQCFCSFKTLSKECGYFEECKCMLQSIHCCIHSSSEGNKRGHSWRPSSSCNSFQCKTRLKTCCHKPSCCSLPNRPFRWMFKTYLCQRPNSDKEAAHHLHQETSQAPETYSSKATQLHSLTELVPSIEKPWHTWHNIRAGKNNLHPRCDVWWVSKHCIYCACWGINVQMQRC